MGRVPEKHRDTLIRFAESDGVHKDNAEYVEHRVLAAPQDEPQEKYWHLLPKELHVKTIHDGAQAHITQEFIRAIVEERHPEVNVWEAAAYTAPGIVAHQSALRGGESMKIPDLGVAPR